jgi:hypothetical protein
MRITTISLLTILCFALSTPTFAQQIYNDGSIDGNDNAFFVTGPNLPNFLGSVMDISNGFVAAASGTPNQLEFGLWSVGAPTSFSYELGTSAFGTDLGSGTVALNAGNSTLLFTNSFGYGVYDVKVGITSAAMTAGNTYWLSISNATDASNDGTQAWDIPNGGSGGPAICNFRQSGTNFGDCGLGGESFTITGGPPGPAPCFSEQPQNGFKVIHDFTGGDDGRYQYGGVTIDKAGKLYGSDCSDDLCDSVDLYRLSRAGQNWMFARLFIGDAVGDTVGPNGGLYGASSAYDNVFNLMPLSAISLTGFGHWTKTVLYHFTGNNDASEPTGVLTFDQVGNLYGTSRLGGGGDCFQGAGCGTVYELTPSKAGWTEKILYSWEGNGVSAEPIALLVGIDGNLYGRTNYAGDYGYGSVYQLAPSGDGWTQTVLYSFTTSQDLPENSAAATGLIQDRAGNLYGTASEGGYGFPHGIIFMLSPSNGNWVFTILRDNYDSADLFNNLAIDSAGNLYGTGGLGVNFGCGGGGPCFAYIFKLVHGSDGWQYSTPVYFSGQHFEVWGYLALDASDNLYGTTVSCGKYNYGTVWEFSP